MFDSETVAFVSGECDASSMKVAFFHRSSPAPAASCAEIVLFPQFQACVIAKSGIFKALVFEGPLVSHSTTHRAGTLHTFHSAVLQQSRS